MVQRDQRHAPAVEMLLAEAQHRLLVAEHLAVVAVDGPDVVGVLPLDALLDHGQRGVLDVQQVQPAAEGRFQDAELRLVAGPDRQRGQRLLQRQRLAERAEDAGQGAGDIHLVVAVARPDLVLLVHVAAGGAQTEPSSFLDRQKGHRSKHGIPPLRSCLRSGVRLTRWRRLRSAKRLCLAVG